MAGRPTKNLSGLEFGYIRVESRLDDGSWRCVCKLCGLVFVRSHKKLTISINNGTRSYCGECLGPQAGRARKAVERPARDWRAATVDKCWNEYRRGASKRGYEWRLSDADVEKLIFDPCAYCGLEGEKDNHGVRYNGIDRVDNGQGYTPENCVACCGICNRAKLTLSPADFARWVERLRSAA